ncbi:nucleoside deaminase [bacterium]|nr:nucleoside deaminase [bacterium]
MQNAIIEAKKCIKDVPIGCVIKKNGQIIASAHNCRELDDDIIAHAEILAIKEAQNILKTSRLTGCELYVTLEPCPMCAWAISMSGISTVYYGSYNKQYGALGSVVKLPLNPNLKIYGGIKEVECNKILEEFFEKIRK